MSLMLAQPRIDVDSRPVPVATFDPPAVRPGEHSTYRVVFNALEESIEWPAKIAAPGLDFAPGAHGQVLQMTGTNLQPRTTFNYHVRPAQPGQFTVPEFTVTVYGKSVTVPAAHLDVSPAVPASAPPAQRLTLQILGTNFYVGQAVHARVLFPGSPAGVIQGLAQVQLTGQGFIVDPSSVRQRIETVPRQGTNTPTYIYETILTPITAGTLSVFAQAYSIGNRFTGTIVISGPAVIPGGLPQYTLLDSDPVEFNVRPLPRSGKLPGFTGAVGSVALQPLKLSTNVVRVGGPLKLTVAVRSDGNVARLVPPPPPRTKDWQVFAASSDNLPPQVVQALGMATFNYTLIPLSEEPKATPPIPFSFFDPERGAYADLTIPPTPLQILPATRPADLNALTKAASANTNREPEPVLSGLATAPGLSSSTLVPLQQRAWFPLIQALPAAAFLALWGWDRRRRFYEQHPNVLLRRRAKRALRRERRKLGRVARAGDQQRFAMTAINCLRIACAPHYPAQPAALVGTDILQVLPEAERSGQSGEVIRRFFHSTDAALFSAHGDTNSTGSVVSAEQPSNLLALRPQLEAVLQILEDKL